MDTFNLRRRLLLAGPLGLAGVAPAATSTRAAEAPRLLCGELPPLTFAGALGGRVELLACAAGHLAAAEAMPWQRAWREAQSLGNAVMFPVARTAERESQWHWIAELAHEPSVLLVSPTALPPTVRRAAFSDFMHLRVGVLRDCVLHEHLCRLGFNGIEPATHDRINAAKLSLGRVQAWLGFQSVVDHWMPPDSAASAGWIRLRGPDWPLYLAGTRDIPPPLIAPWQQAHGRAARMTAHLAGRDGRSILLPEAVPPRRRRT